MDRLLDTTEPSMQKIAAMSGVTTTGPRPTIEVAPASETNGERGQHGQHAVPVKRPYEPPRIERRIPIIANTLISGSECVFPGDPCD